MEPQTTPPQGATPDPIVQAALALKSLSEDLYSPERETLKPDLVKARDLHMADQMSALKHYILTYPASSAAGALAQVVRLPAVAASFFHGDLDLNPKGSEYLRAIVRCLYSIRAVLAQYSDLPPEDLEHHGFTFGGADVEDPFRWPTPAPHKPAAPGGQGADPVAQAGRVLNDLVEASTAPPPPSLSESALEALDNHRDNQIETLERYITLYPARSAAGALAQAIVLKDYVARLAELRDHATLAPRTLNRCLYSIRAVLAEHSDTPPEALGANHYARPEFNPFLFPTPQPHGETAEEGA